MRNGICADVKRISGGCGTEFVQMSGEIRIREYLEYGLSLQMDQGVYDIGWYGISQAAGQIFGNMVICGGAVCTI